MSFERTINLEFEHWLHTTRAGSLSQISTLPDPSAQPLTSIKLSMQSADDLFSKGLRLKKEENFKSALNAFRSATQLLWDFTAAHIEAGNCASAMHQYELALDFYGSAIETNLSSPIPYYNIALTHVDLGNECKAIEWLDQTLAIGPNYRPAYIKLAQRYSIAGRDRAAISLLIKAAYLNPYSATPMIAAGILYYRNTLEAEAIRCFERAIRIDSWNSEAYFRLGFAQYRKGDFARASRSLSLAVNCDGENKIAATLLRVTSKQLRPRKRRTTMIQKPLFPAPQLISA